MDIGSRLETLLKEKGWPQKTLAKHIGISQAYVSQICRGVRMPSSDVIRSICKALEVPVSYLLDEMGECYLTHREKLLLGSYRKLSLPEQSLISRMIDALASPDSNHISTPTKVIRLPIFNDPAAAGQPLYAESSFEYVEFDADEIPDGAEFGIRISGDSMEPTISNGQIVFVARQSELSNGDIGIFMLDGGNAICKRYHSSKNGIALLSDNPAYKALKEQDILDSHLVGKVLLPDK